MRAALLLLSMVACERQSSEQPSWVVVELVPAPAAPSAEPLNAEVYIAPVDGQAVGVCVGVDGTAGTPTASLLLERARDADATAPVRLTITPYRELGNRMGAPAGEAFTCPDPFPPPLAPPQDLEIRFCAGQTRRVVFHVAARCGCGGEGGAGGAGGGAGGAGGSASTCCESTEICGAGISANGSVCGADECCTRLIDDACFDLLPP